MIHDGREAFGGYLEDFKPGDVFKGALQMEMC